ncbi:MAG: phosphatase PAP2 family protein [Bradymonadaceae bacterium]
MMKKPEAMAWIAVGAAILGYHLVNPLRLEHLLMLSGVGLAMKLARPTREFVIVFLPLILFAWFYDLLRIFSDRANEIVTIAEIRELELAIFGWLENGERVGPVEFFLEHHHPLLDLIGAPVYASHVATIIFFGVILWWRSRKAESEEDESRLARFLWGFLFLNLLGFCVQVLYPVAPPWYVELYGYAMPENGISGNPAGLARVDDLIGIDYFQGVYEQAAYVFGALPSLHVAYPVWLALHVRRPLGKALCAIYALAMAFFAVYFIHHYVVDLVAGAALSILVYALFARTPLGTMPGRVHRYFGAHFLDDRKSRYLLETLRR